MCRSHCRITITKNAAKPLWIDFTCAGVFDLLPMLENYAYRFVRLIEEVERFRVASMNYPKNGPFEIQGAATESYIRFLHDVKDQAEALQMNAIVSACSRIESLISDRFMLTALPEKVSGLYDSIKDELKGIKFLHIPTGRAGYFADQYKEFSRELYDRFPQATLDFVQSGKCFACGLWTATVFHIMRAAEAGLDEIEKHLSLPIKNENWGEVLREFKKAVDNMTGDEKRKWGDILANFRSLKDIWRNRVMHLDQKYDEDEAKFSFRKVRELLCSIKIAIPI